MARITVEDCLKKIDSQYELVMLAKERTAQLNSGNPMLVPQDNDKNTVVALREIAEGKVSTKTLEDHGIDKLRKHQESKATAAEEDEIVEEDNFDKIYKGEVSKSGTAILPSKRSKKIPETIKVSEEPEPEPEIENSTEESVKDPIAEEKISEDSEPNQ
jgi:DNA-directed RNA polymerase subunit omega